MVVLVKIFFPYKKGMWFGGNNSIEKRPKRPIFCRANYNRHSKLNLREKSFIHPLNTDNVEKPNFKSDILLRNYFTLHSLLPTQINNIVRIVR